MEEPRVRIKVSDMDVGKSQFAQKLAIDFLRERGKDEKELAKYLKQQFDQKFGTKWHCVVGASFGSHVTHHSDDFLFFIVEKRGILLFRTV
ncbi:hypothetical protein QR680_017048 [Steinernema hermaphroditum]|uniref:Dynein light chain n=1 Tax=Steinernema hermaphroditum TaxID=289476 RepID=A0AA39HFB0_9BILA|nr:hypothetical protein QR680_017048 [Steinernema hermaphroditum]